MPYHIYKALVIGVALFMVPILGWIGISIFHLLNTTQEDTN